MFVVPDVGATDLNRAARGRRCLECRYQIVEHIAECDRLRLRAHPARGNHYREALNQVTQNLERRRARANDHCGAENGDGDTRLAECGFYRAARGEVFTQGVIAIAEPAQVDDARDPRGRGRLAEGAGNLEVAFVVVISHRFH